MPEAPTLSPLKDLGPFRPPSSLEPEFHAPVPRPVPETLRRGTYGRKRRAALWFSALFSASAYVCWWATRGTTLDFYFLAMPYFHLVAAASAAVGVALATAQRFFPGRYRYLRDGAPMPARVRDIRLEVSARSHGSASQYHYVCTVDYRAPGECETRLAVIASPDFSEILKDATETPLRVGDYVTAVELAGKPITLYGFLQLNPEVDFVRRKRRKPGQGTALRGALIWLTFVYLFLGIMLAVTALPSMSGIGLPEDADWGWGVPAAVVAAIGGAVLAWIWMRRSETKRQAAIEARNASARAEGRPIEELGPVVAGRFNRALLILAGALMPVILGALGIGTLNAVLDESPARYEAVAITDFYHETWLGIFRNYEVRYQRAGRSHGLNVPVTQLGLLDRTMAEQGALEWHTGRFGLPWIANLHPLVVDSDGRARVLLSDDRENPMPQNPAP
jgi:hypothetical protein